MVKNNVDIKGLFSCMQNELSQALNTGRQHISHPVSKGDVSEAKWRNWLIKYLPKRYAVEKGFLIDSNGNISEQIDAIIYDMHYSPFIFNDGEFKYIPAESVYCVFEVKQTLNKYHIEYAVKKANSVDILHRTSSRITAITGVHEPKEPFKILRGILTTDSEWAEGINSDSFKELILQNHLDFGCSIDDRSFSKEGSILKISEKDEGLIFFFLKLLSRLSELGTVPAISIEAYAQSLDSEF
jgi:hypothetical protein